MFIESIHIENYRSIREIEVTCPTLVALVGRNSTGKSTVLNALDAFFDVSKHFSEFDYFAQDMNNEIKIRLTFASLTEEEKTEFSSQIASEKLTVSKIITPGGVKYFGNAKEYPVFHEIRNLGAVPKRTKLNELISSGELPGFTETVGNQADADALMLAFEEANPDLLEVFQKEQQFLGPKNIGGGKLDKIQDLY